MGMPPPPSTSRLLLAPCLPRSVGFLPVLFPPERRFGYCPVHGKPVPVDPSQFIILAQAPLPDLQEHSRFAPLLEPSMGAAAGADACRIQRVPLAAGAQDEEDGVHSCPVIDALAVAAQGVGLPGRQERVNLLPHLVGQAPVTAHFLNARDIRVRL